MLTLIWLDPLNLVHPQSCQDIHPLALTPTLLLQSQGSNPESGAQLFSFGKQGIQVGCSKPNLSSHKVGFSQFRSYPNDSF